jgi:creatinine amidohydrolase
MMHLYPELIDKKEICSTLAGGGSSDVITYEKFSDRTKNGCLGDALAATPEKGRLIVERCVERIVEYMNEAF